MNDMFQSPMTTKIWDTYIDPGVTSFPTTQEIRDKNFNKLYNILLKDGYTYTEKIVKCTDGEEYEITEIRGPKASGFFCTLLRSTNI